MPTAVLKAHFDGEHFVLGEPFPLQPNVPLMVTVCGSDAEQSEWAALGKHGLARAYGIDEPEYTEADLKAR